MFSHLGKTNIYFFFDTIEARSFKLRIILTLIKAYIFILVLMTLTFSRSQVRQKHKLQITCFRFLSTAVQTLYSCYIHEKDHAQYDFCNSGMYSRKIINTFWVRQVSGLVRNFNIGIFLDT